MSFFGYRREVGLGSIESQAAEADALENWQERARTLHRRLANKKNQLNSGKRRDWQARNVLREMKPTLAHWVKARRGQWLKDFRLGRQDNAAVHTSDKDVFAEWDHARDILKQMGARNWFLYYTLPDAVSKVYAEEHPVGEDKTQHSTDAEALAEIQALHAQQAADKAASQETDSSDSGFVPQFNNRRGGKSDVLPGENEEDVEELKLANPTQLQKMVLHVTKVMNWGARKANSTATPITPKEFAVARAYLNKYGRYALQPRPANVPEEMFRKYVAAAYGLKNALDRIEDRLPNPDDGTTLITSGDGTVVAEITDDAPVPVVPLDVGPQQMTYFETVQASMSEHPVVWGLGVVGALGAGYWYGKKVV